MCIRFLLSVILLLSFVSFSYVPGVYAIELPQAFLSESVYDFGVVSEGARVSHSFELVNRGEADLRIDRVVPGCGCTVVKTPPKAIAPGNSTALEVEFDTSGFSGEKVKSVRVHTNDPKNSVILLTLKGVINTDVLAKPSRVYFGDISKGQRVKRTVNIEVAPDSNTQVLQVKSFSPLIELETSDLDSSTKQVTVFIDPEDRLGPIRTRVVVYLSGKKRRSINIPIFANVVEPVTAKPEAVSFDIITGKEDLTKIVSLESASGYHYTSSYQASSPHPALTADIAKLDNGSPLVRIILNPNKVEADLNSFVEVVPSDKNLLPLRIPVSAFLAPDRG